MPTELLLKEIQAKYSIGDINHIEKLTGGYWNAVFRLETNQQNIVLRISHPSTTFEAITYEHRLIREMHAYIKEIPLPLYMEDGDSILRYDKQLVSLFPFFDGQIADINQEAVRINAAEMLAKLHLAGLELEDMPQKPYFQAIKDLNWETNRMWNSALLKESFFEDSNWLAKQLAAGYSEADTAALKEINHHKKLIREEKELIRKWSLDLVENGPNLLAGPIHGDYYRGNILTTKDGKITALIDWDECCKEWFVYELARSVWEFCIDEKSGHLNRSHAQKFISAYKRAGGPLSESEAPLIIPFIRYVRLIEILFDLQQGLSGESWDPEYLAENLTGLITLKDEPLL